MRTPSPQERVRKGGHLVGQDEKGQNFNEHHAGSKKPCYEEREQGIGVT